ncbi:hypothetical protein L1987_24481 [Smallanthus sonchifolius]|uniref:Uncharacterized protein n=1 Tax=Smallanthus sonchifolius TaxID=185202 RepID=A0ACB9IKK9_9ASTR|nr:hypothetical protein L1987_24481 [Smallanthus sonchifolius]
MSKLLAYGETEAVVIDDDIQEVAVKLLKSAVKSGETDRFLKSAVKSGETDRFLTDGFPKSEDNHQCHRKLGTEDEIFERLRPIFAT